ncbi:hypothetical protein [Methylibium petroleiphilum]
MHFLEADDAYFKIVSERGSGIFGTIAKTEFPESYRAMFGFCAKTNSLKTAMFDCIESNNPYAFNALFRCFCEHYLKFMYIWTRLLSEKTDKIGAEYFSFCGASEARGYVSAITMAEGLLGNTAVADIEAAISQMYPATAGMSPKQMEQASGQFKYRAILRFLAGDAFRFVEKDRPFLAQIIPQYALLSSFVHGGPYTDMEMAEYSEPRAIESCEKNAGIVFLMTATVFMLTCMVVSREHPEAAETAGQVHQILRKFIDEAPDET